MELIATYTDKLSELHDKILSLMAVEPPDAEAQAVAAALTGTDSGKAVSKAQAAALEYQTAQIAIEAVHGQMLETWKHLRDAIEAERKKNVAFYQEQLDAQFAAHKAACKPRKDDWIEGVPEAAPCRDPKVWERIFPACGYCELEGLAIAEGGLPSLRDDDFHWLTRRGVMPSWNDLVNARIARRKWLLIESNSGRGLDDLPRLLEILTETIRLEAEWQAIPL